MTATEALRNGELLDAAEAAGFDVFLTTDRNIRYQQSLTGRRLERYLKSGSGVAFSQRHLR